jgi:cyclophilin family peptidyl-prolyl cis-trans isomerase
VPVSQKPRKQRHRTPPATSRRRERPLFQRIVFTTGMGILVVGLALLTVSSVFRKQEAVKQQDPDNNEQTTTTELDPIGGVPCPLPEGQERRMQFPPTGVPQCLTIGHTYKARVSTDAGAFVIALDPSKAPVAVNVFVVLARYHFYDNLTFHKAVPGFFTQSGDPPEEGVTGPGFTFDDRLPNSKEYVTGSVMMANQRIGANGSQFLMLVQDAPNLRAQYPLIGQVVEGLDVVRKIASDGDDKGEPKDPVHRLLRITITESQ